MMSDKKKLRIVMLIQARMGSTRLPGKPLKMVLEKPLISFLIERLRRCQNIDQIVVATTTNPLDDQIVNFCHQAHLTVFRGNETDVLERYVQGARAFHADVIIRITADCPLIDPSVIDQVVSFYLDQYPRYDYVSNTLERTYPRGMDVEVFSRESLEIAAKEARNAEDREHVTPFIYHHPDKFSLGSMERSGNESHYRLTVDEPDDFRLISTILTEIYPKKPDFHLEDLLVLLRNHPEWVEINAHVMQKELNNGK